MQDGSNGSVSTLFCRKNESESRSHMEGSYSTAPRACDGTAGTDSSPPHFCGRELGLCGDMSYNKGGGFV